jgi:hypothetical protein
MVPDELLPQANQQDETNNDECKELCTYNVAKASNNKFNTSPSWLTKFQDYSTSIVRAFILDQVKFETNAKGQEVEAYTFSNDQAVIVPYFPEAIQKSWGYVDEWI